ncbi:hypothetical protein EG68_03267 [Paragonimus skrjabini miyazakii]|uniref:Uncharacterized protein n=1 Tax=Paragonimus skrjabini miyazakii TaxID=59628 RepID=A0A8S9Z0K6_9TREM|nr:hypothetical protein EG68_03267 [Paragonimus skrjabini miyazakii]
MSSTDPDTAALIVGAFNGQAKPENVNEYFQDVMDEMMGLHLHGYCHAGSVNKRKQTGNNVTSRGSVVRWKHLNFVSFCSVPVQWSYSKSLSQGNTKICINVLSSGQLANHYLSFAGKVLLKKVDQFGALYGMKGMVFNIHSLTPLCEDLRRSGPLDGFQIFHSNYTHPV